MTLIGIASTLINLTMYTSVIYIVPEKHYGLAFGILQAISNIGIIIGSLLIGYIKD